MVSFASVPVWKMVRQISSDFLFGRPFPAGCPADIPYMLFARSGPVGFLSHLRSLRRYNEQEILHFSLTQICLVNADAGQVRVAPRRGDQDSS